LSARAPDGTHSDVDFDTGDVYRQLFARRMVMATGAIDAERVDLLTSQLLTLDAEGDDPVQLVVDAPSADLDAAYVLFDVCEALSAPLEIVVAGRLGDAGVVLLTGRGRRLGRPNARLHLCEPRFEPTTATAEQASRLVAEQRRRIGDLIERISERTTRPAPLVADDLSRGLYLSSDEAVAYGLLDEVLRPPVR